MKWIGITGGIATGKSAVTKIIQDLGLVVIDADVLAREVVEKGSFGFRALVQIFGDQIVSSDGVLQREELGKIIFQDGKARLILEKILHPLIQWRALQEKMVLEAQGHKIAFYDAALIFEKDLSSKFDSVIVVKTDFDIQKKRLMERSKISEAEAEKRIAAQLSLEEKIKKAHYVIDNNDDLKKTRIQIKDLLEKFQ